MAKRFTDTELWDKEWFMNLSPKLKCLVKYVRDKSDLAGVWSPNWILAVTYIKEAVTENELLLIDEGKQFEKLPNGKINCIDFIAFQYGTLSEKSPVHRKIMTILESHKIGYKYPINRVVEEDKEQDKEKDKEKEKEKSGKTIHTQCITAYHDWFLEKFEMKPQIDGSDAKGMKAIIEFLDKNQPGDENVLRNWKMILSIHNRWEDFYQKQTRIRQIASFITNIFTSIKLKQQKNGTGSAISAVDKRFS